jgi:hypothetical protein
MVDRRPPQNRQELDSHFKNWGAARIDVLLCHAKAMSREETACKLYGWHDEKSKKTAINSVNAHYQKIYEAFGLKNKELCPLIKDRWDELDEVCIRCMPEETSSEIFHRRGYTISNGFPSGPMYEVDLERPEEKLGYKALARKQMLLRFRAPYGYGKTTILFKLEKYAEEQLGCKTAYIDFRSTPTDCLDNADSFLCWICESLQQQLNWDEVTKIWQESIAASGRYRKYLRYGLENQDAPLVLLLDNLDYLFNYPNLAQDFLPLIRQLFENTRRGKKIWDRLYQVVAYSTDIYIKLSENMSPLNVGYPIQLETFNTKDIQVLALRHGIQSFSLEDSESLEQWVNGHPHLIQLVLYYLSQENIHLAQFKSQVSIFDGIKDHLGNRYRKLENNPELLEAYRVVISSEEPRQLDMTIAKKLVGMGLVSYVDKNYVVKSSCELYQEYFSGALNCMSDSDSHAA